MRGRQKGSVLLLAVLLILVSSGGVFGQSQDASGVGAFPELAAAGEPIGRFVSSNTILAGSGDSRRTWSPVSDEACIVAYEENSHFICALAVVSGDDDSEGPTLLRRLLLLKPSTIVLDDAVDRTSFDGALRWRVGCRAAATIDDGGRLRFADAEGQATLKTLWPKGQTLQQVPTDRANQTVYQLQAPRTDARMARWINIVHTRAADNEAASPTTALKPNNGCLELTVTTPDRVFRLTLPTPGDGAGLITVESVDGKTLVPQRPLPSGVLPHGPEGLKLIERWDRAYRDGRAPAWDSGIVAADLKKAVENGQVKPCRTAVLGCGSGTNSIYLAKKGFDVTAIDIAPTALSIARRKAAEADVEVNWVLADVLKLPELEPFDFIFDRGCYHNVRYVDATGFVNSLAGLSHEGTRCLILSLNRDSAPGVREATMREDLGPLYDFEWLRESEIQTGAEGVRRSPSWSLMLRWKGEE